MTVRLLALTLCIAGLATFGWGMACFFHRSSTTAATRAVALIGAVCAAWHLWSIGHAPAGVWRMAAASVLDVAAIALFLWATRTFRGWRPAAIFEPGVSREIVRSGPYTYVRHPFYVSYILFWTAGWVASASWITGTSVVLMSVLYVRAAMQEEAWLRGALPFSTYDAYRRATGFMIPRVW
jgi:protein-S-isoprenylcysteine O-methyltransferase Ste14